jgi:DNA topoisomerase VI subunit B
MQSALETQVENSLDASESIGVLPEIHILLEEISHSKFRQMHGMDLAEKVLPKTVWGSGFQSTSHQK